MISRTGRIDKRDLSEVADGESLLPLQPDGNRYNRIGSWMVLHRPHRQEAVDFALGT